MIDVSGDAKSCFFTDLARAYCPYLTARYASRTLRRWIRLNGRLSSLLADTGYSDTCRLLTPKQVAVIMDGADFQRACACVSMVLMFVLSY